MENGPFEDIFPIQNGDFPASYVSFREGAWKDFGPFKSQRAAMNQAMQLTKVEEEHLEATLTAGFGWKVVSGCTLPGSWKTIKKKASLHLKIDDIDFWVQMYFLLKFSSIYIFRGHSFVSGFVSS